MPAEYYSYEWDTDAGALWVTTSAGRFGPFSAQWPVDGDCSSGPDVFYKRVSLSAPAGTTPPPELVELFKDGSPVPFDIIRRATGWLTSFFVDRANGMPQHECESRAATFANEITDTASVPYPRFFVSADDEMYIETATRGRFGPFTGQYDPEQDNVIVMIGTPPTWLDARNPERELVKAIQRGVPWNVQCCAVMFWQNAMRQIPHLGRDVAFEDAATRARHVYNATPEKMEIQ